MEAIAETGSVTRAAERLHFTQSALSHQLRELEEQLGTALFHRGARRMTPTEAGERLLRTSANVLAELAEAEGDVRLSGQSSGQAVMRIATECYTCYHWLPRVLASLRTRWPRAEIRVVPDATRRPIAALLDGRLDVAIVDRRLKSQRIVYEALFDDPFVVVMAPSHRLANRLTVPPHELSRETLVLYRSESESLVMSRVLRPAGIVPKDVLQVQLTEAILELVRADMGITIMAEWAVREQIHRGGLVARPLATEHTKRQWSAAYRKRRTLSPILVDLVGELHRVGPNQDPVANESWPDLSAVRPLYAGTEA